MITTQGTPRAGFTLVLALSVMAMLLLLGLSAATILTVELKVARSANANARTRLNTAAAARIALGEMQRLLGPDRRVTANADILRGQPGYAALTRPKLAGVWRGGCVAYDYAGAHTDAFLGWLTSGATADGKPLNAVSGAPATLLRAGATGTAASGDTWALLPIAAPYAGAPAFRDPTETAATLSLRAAPEMFSGNPKDASVGGFAWIAMDENQKARVNLHDYRDDGLDERTRKAFAAGAAARFHPGHPGDPFAADWSPTLRTRKTQRDWRDLIFDLNDAGVAWAPIDPATGAPAAALRHDFTTASLSLLTDPVHGGLKRDVNLLALMSESDFNTLPGIGFESKTAQGWIGADPDRQAWAAGNITGLLGGKMPWADSDTAGLLFPLWSDVRRRAKFPTTGPLDDGLGPVVDTDNGVPFAKMAESAEVASATRNAIALTPGVRSVQRDDALHRTPVMHRMRIEYTLESRQEGATWSVAPRINYIIQLWNPYNVRLRLAQNPGDAFWFFSFNPPMTLNIYVNGQLKGSTKLFASDIRAGVPLAGKTDEFLEPGEIRTFSLPKTETNTNFADQKMVRGYKPLGGVLLNNPNAAGANTSAHKIPGLKPEDTIAVAVVRSTVAGYQNLIGAFELYRGPKVRGNAAPGVATWIGTFGSATTTKAPDQSTWFSFKTKTPEPLAQTDLGPVSALAPPPDKPLAVIDIRLKTEKTAQQGTRLTEIPVLQQMTLAPAGDQRRGYNRVAYEWLGWSTGGADDPEDPHALQIATGAGGIADQGYGGPGHTPATGILNPVFYHLPLTPPMGLLDLSDARLSGGTRPRPSDLYLQSDEQNLGYTVHRALGNSLAHYAVPRESIAAATVDGADFLSGGLRALDHSWFLNTVMADTWFASSLGDWNEGATGKLFSVKKNLPALVKDLFAGKARLPNRRLAPLGDDPSADWIAGPRATKVAFRTAAARLAVEGGFNINSTSVRAWRAFLASSRDAGFLRLDKTGALVAGATAAPLVKSGPFPTEEPAKPGGNDNPARYNGGRELSDDQLDKLAQALVAEVRKRGPFLSLGEFLNRRIETGELGVKGAVQAAIDTAGINDGLKTTGRALSALGQQNPTAEAAHPHAGVGSPGWVGQADLLAPLATALTARGDTFLVRVAAETGDGAREHLELTVRRSPEFLAASEPPETETGKLTQPANRAFGRRLRIVAARRLRGDET